jgi:hypothetical protein
MQIQQLFGFSAISSAMIIAASTAFAQAGGDGYSAEGYAQAGVYWDGSDWRPYVLGTGRLDVPFSGDGSMPAMGFELSFSGAKDEVFEDYTVFPVFYFGVGNTRVSLGLPDSAMSRADLGRDLGKPYGSFGLYLSDELWAGYGPWQQYFNSYSPGVRIDGRIGGLDVSASYLYETDTGVPNIAVAARYDFAGGLSVSGAAEVATGVPYPTGYFLGVAKDAGPVRYSLQYGRLSLVADDYASGYVEYDISDGLIVGASGVKYFGSTYYLVGVDARYQLDDFSLDGSYLTGGVMADDAGVVTANFAIGMDF